MNVLMESYAVEQATLRARLLSATAGFPPDEIGDARQELLLDYLRRAPKFDSTRGDRPGFVRGVMRNHATVLIARRSRHVRHEVLADDLGEPGSENGSGVLEIIHRCDPTTALQVSLDVQRVLRRLPRHLRSLAALIPEMPISEVCVMIGKSRTRTYQMIREIRNAFVAAGLKPRRAPGPHAGAIGCRPIELTRPERRRRGGR